MKLLLQTAILLVTFLFAQSSFLRSLSQLSETPNSNTDIMQQILSGFWSELDIQGSPELVAVCLNEASAGLIVDITNQTLSFLAQNNTLSAIRLCTQFIKKLEPTIEQCGDAIAVTEAVKDAFGIKGLSYNQIGMNVGIYYLTHAAKAYGTIVDIDNDFQAGNYIGVGQSTANFFAQIFNKK